MGWMQRCTLIVVLPAIFLLGPSGRAIAAEVPLFLETAADSEVAGFEAGAPFLKTLPVLQQRPVTLAPGLAESETLRPGDTLVLDLFEGETRTATVDRIHVNVSGTVSLRARIADSAYGYLLLSTTGPRSLGKIALPELGRQYMVQSDPVFARHYLVEVDPARMDELPETPPRIPPAGAESMAAGAPGTLNDPQDPAVIDVMIVYTPAARGWAEEFGGGIDNVVAQSMELAQLSHDNSDTFVTLPLVHVAEVDYVESGCSGLDLDRLTTSPTFSLGPPTQQCNAVTLPVAGFMDEVHEWRDEFGADLVAFYGLVEDTGGLAWLLNDPMGMPNFGFSLTRVQQAATGLTHVHELGHNMGCGHHWEQLEFAGPGMAAYSSGGRWLGLDGTHYCSLMTYGAGIYWEDEQTHVEVPHFSNPDVVHQGMPTGDALLSDNARTVRETKHAIAAYRPTAYDHLVRFETDGTEGALLQGNALQGVVDGGATTPVTALAAPRTELVSWTVNGAAFSVDNPVVVENVTADMVVTANFGPFENMFCSEPGVVIPDGQAAGVTDDIVVLEDAEITRLTVQVVITHDWVGDLRVSLEHVESGITVQLIDQPGLPDADPDWGCFNSDFNVVLDDEGTGGSVQDQCAQAAQYPSSPPNYTPVEALAAFNGISTEGTWRLVASDVALGQEGVLEEWCLFFEIESDNGEPPVPGDFNGDGRVNLEDLLILLDDWGTVYGLQDLLDLLDNWGLD